jgi:DNA mismatch endonuclease (patch repair protein)
LARGSVSPSALMRDPEVTSRIMAAVHSRDTKPEVALRSMLWRRGLRFMVRSKLTGKPDIVFPSARLAVFVDGDFWHGNAWRIRGLPSFEAQFERINNAALWRAKIEGNMGRDLHVNTELSSAGWQVYRVFESRLKDESEQVVAEIEELVRGGHTTRRTACVTSAPRPAKIVKSR